ncbi:alpha-ketoglutarate-dependent dioxygenase alkB homolog 3-like [Bolinopsis microptera]|uniref:alpha-ketoglutarate-dependent dioxygenase alkB homolog 3-like n=1 Tax=Bolinopsis microptera TaxID=2820187 RepID=UPI00307999EA
MQDRTLTEDNSRSTRSRNNSSPLDGNVIDFTKPITITTPGCYVLSNPDSGCRISLFQDVFASQLCDQFSSEIENTGTLKQYNSIHRQSQAPLPRLSSWFGPVDYAFSGIVMKANSVSQCPRLIAAYQNMAENLFTPNNIDCSSDCFLINQYRTGRDSCGEHSDNEPEVDLSKPVVTLSLGQQRCMLIREAKNPGNAITVQLDQGSVLVMHGTDFQKKYTHQIPKDNVITNSRTSVTYRTCSSTFLRNRSALSTPLKEISITPILAPKTPGVSGSPSLPLHNRRRSSLSLSSFSQVDTSSVGSPVASSSPSITSSKTSVSDSDTLPLSIEAMLEAIDLMKDKTCEKRTFSPWQHKLWNPSGL